MLEEGIYSLLADAGEITVLIGTPATRLDGTTGIFPDVIQELCDLPCIVYRVVSGMEHQTLSGRGDLRSKRIEFSAFASISSDAKRTAAAVKDVLIAFQGTLSDGTAVGASLFASEVGDFEKAPKAAQETGGRALYRAAVDVEFLYTEAS